MPASHLYAAYCKVGGGGAAANADAVKSVSFRLVSSLAKRFFPDSGCPNALMFQHDVLF